jgi:hypothetical protein
MKTAVEWLESIISSMILNGGDSDLLSVLTHCKKAKEMEKEQSECICVNVIDRILDESEQGKEINSKQIFEDVYKETFKPE